MPAQQTATVFLDTSGLFALLNEDDAYHDQAQSLMRDLDTQGASTVTTDWVIAELLGLASGRRIRRISAAFVRALLQNPRVGVAEATRPTLLAALALFERRPDKEWSLVDCQSMLTCKEMGIVGAFTADHHFAQAGLKVLLT